MYTKQYHSKVAEIDELDNLRLEEHIQTLQKETKYYSNNDDTAIKKRLIDHYDPVPSTHDSNFQNNSNTLLNQLHDAIQSYRPAFKDSLLKSKPNYISTNFETEIQEIISIQEEAIHRSEIHEPIKFEHFQKIESVKPRFSRVDKDIAALYSQNRNPNLEYRKQKFMQLFLRPNDYSKY